MNCLAHSKLPNGRSSGDSVPSLAPTSEGRRPPEDFGKVALKEYSRPRTTHCNSNSHVKENKNNLE